MSTPKIVIAPEILKEIKILLVRHKLANDGGSNATSILSHNDKDGFVLNNTYPVGIEEVFTRLERAGANVEALRKKHAETKGKADKEAERIAGLKKSAAAKLTKEEREVLGL